MFYIYFHSSGFKEVRQGQKTPLRLCENALTFYLKRTCVLLETQRRLTANALAFFSLHLHGVNTDQGTASIVPISSKPTSSNSFLPVSSLFCLYPEFSVLNSVTQNLFCTHQPFICSKIPQIDYHTSFLHLICLKKTTTRS